MTHPSSQLKTKTNGENTPNSIKEILDKVPDFSGALDSRLKEGLPLPKNEKDYLRREYTNIFIQYSRFETIMH